MFKTFVSLLSGHDQYLAIYGTVTRNVAPFPSIRPLGTTRLPLDVASNLTFEYLLEICPENSSLIDI